MKSANDLLDVCNKIEAQICENCGENPAEVLHEETYIAVCKPCSEADHADKMVQNLAKKRKKPMSDEEKDKMKKKFKDRMKS